MRRLPWRVALRADRKAVLTALGVAVGAAFAFVSLIIPALLDAETVSATGAYGNPETLVARADGSPFRAQDAGVAGPAVLLAEAPLAGGGSVWLAAIEGPDAPLAPEGTAGAFDGQPGDLALLGVTLQLTVRGPDARLDPRWLLVAPADLRAIAPDFAPDRVSYVIADAPPAALPDDFVARESPGIGSFFTTSAAEVAVDLVVVVAFASVLVALLAYEFLRSEVRAREAEIGIWRALGMRSPDVLALLVARGTTITLAGVALGAFAAGLLALRLRDRIPVLDVVSRAWPVALALALAGFLGALIPARATAAAPARIQAEVGA